MMFYQVPFFSKFILQNDNQRHDFCLLLQVFLTKHYRNRRLGDPEFVLDFEEIYVIDSKTKSITRAKVIVRFSSVPQITLDFYLRN